MPPTRNEKFDHALSQSHFATLADLARHSGLHYRSVQSYAILERKPIDRRGIVKHDAAAICTALDCALEDLFPDEFIDRPYRFRESYDDGYGQRAFKGRLKKYHLERSLTDDQVDALIALLDCKAVIPADAAAAVAEELVRRIPQDEYEVLSRYVFDGMSMKDIDAVLGIGGKAVRARYGNALKQLNSPVTLKVIREWKARS